MINLKDHEYRYSNKSGIVKHLWGFYWRDYFSPTLNKKHVTRTYKLDVTGSIPVSPTK